jgi:uncharacterized protein (TIGR02246 family)
MSTSTGVIEAWQKAFLAGDANGIADLYEDDAIFVSASMDIVAKGRDAIRDAWAGIIAMGTADDVEITERTEEIAGDVAYAHQYGVIRGEMGGERVEIQFRTTEVMRRGADGTWRYVIDHA